MKKSAVRDELVDWINKNQRRFTRQPVESVADSIADFLETLDGQLGVEIAEVEGVTEVIITAYSDPVWFRCIQQAVARFEPCEGVRYLALKPARGFDFKLNFDGVSLQAKSLRFAPLSDVEGGIALLCPPESEPPAHDLAAEEVGWLVVETGLGEEAAASLAHVEFHAEGYEDAVPIEELGAWLAHEDAVR